MSAPSSDLFTTSLPELYERFLVAPLFRPFGDVLIERLSPSAGERVLDVACGTGIVARLARERVGPTGRVVGIDASPAMLVVAAKAEPAIEWRQGSASELPVAADEQFDVVCCHQGLQFFPDKAQALREMRRVAGPRARVAVATWRSASDIPMVRDLQAIAERQLGPIVDQRHSLGDAALLSGLVVDAGFADVRSETVSLTIRFDDPVLFARLNTMALVGMSAAARTMTEEQRAQARQSIVSESEEMCRRHYADGTFALATNLVTASA